jgi:hypothetical protein
LHGARRDTEEKGAAVVALDDPVLDPRRLEGAIAAQRVAAAEGSVGISRQVRMPIVDIADWKSSKNSGASPFEAPR